MTRTRAGLLALACCIAVLVGGLRTSPILIPATTCTNQFIRSIAAATGVGTCQTVNFATDGTGIVPAANGGAGTINGALKGNGSGTVSQAAASDLSNGVTGSGSVVLATSPSFNSGATQFPTTIMLQESTHATSRRAAAAIGNNWQVLQDTAGNGTRDFCLYGGGTPGCQLTISTAGGITLNSYGAGILVSSAGGVVTASTARATLPTKQVFTSSSGTYTTPANALWIEITLVGGGGGGGGGGVSSGTGGNGGNTCWNTSGAACTSPVYQAGGGTGGVGNGTTPTAGGAISGSGSCDWSVPGGQGSVGPIVSTSGASQGGIGGVSSLGGAGASAIGNNTGGTAATNSGSGGAGGGSVVATDQGGNGGGAGGTCHIIINTPAASYTYVVGSGGGGGTGGTGATGAIGGAGAAGQIIIYEHYGT